MKQSSAARFLKTKSSFHSGLRYLLPGSSLSRNVNNLTIVAIMAVLAGALTTAICADAGEDTALQPPKITIELSSSQQVADGFLFVAPKVAGISGGTSPGATGPEIVDNNGRPVWFLPVTNGQSPADFRVQKYHHRPVLTWAQEEGFGGLAQDQSVDYILDSSYRLVATVRAGNGLNADAHEFLISPEDTALITIYNALPRDLSSVGGSSSGQLIEGVIQEIDIASGKVIFEWHSLDHVGIEESYLPLPKDSTTPWDYFHLNAISIDNDGNLLISARHTSTVYKIDRHSGNVIWRLGGKKSDYSLGLGVRFWYQHNPTTVGRNIIQIFDNESNGTPILPYSRVIQVRIDPLTRAATLARSIQHPDGLSAGSQGNAQALDNGDTLVGWGSVGRFSEFDSEGRLIFDAAVPSGEDTYRAYRFVWHGHPRTEPTATAQRQPDGSTMVHAIWNGATDVARWDVLNASSDQDDRSGDQDSRNRHDWRSVASLDWNGLDTTIPVARYLAFVRVVARNQAGREIGRSEITAVVP